MSVLNTGEAISPRSAWISMCRSEVEGIRLKVECQLREKLKVEEELCRSASSSDQCLSRSSTYPPLSEAKSRMGALLEEMNRQYENEISVAVGELEGDLSSQVRLTSDTLFSQALDDANKLYLFSYDKYFCDWIRCLVKVENQFVLNSCPLFCTPSGDD